MVRTYIYFSTCNDVLQKCSALNEMPEMAGVAKHSTIQNAVLIHICVTGFVWYIQGKNVPDSLQQFLVVYAVFIP